MSERTYVGVKVVKATPMSLTDFVNKTGRNPYSNNPNPAPNLQEGYAVTYEDGYVGYSPKSVFEESYKLINSLNVTCKGVISSDYKERFLAEYYALRVRIERLQLMCDRWDRGQLTFNPTCPREIYTHQLTAMNSYLKILEERAKLENIDLVPFSEE